MKPSWHSSSPANSTWRARSRANALLAPLLIPLLRTSGCQPLATRPARALDGLEAGLGCTNGLGLERGLQPHDSSCLLPIWQARRSAPMSSFATRCSKRMNSGCVSATCLFRTCRGVAEVESWRRNQMLVSGARFRAQTQSVLCACALVLRGPGNRECRASTVQGSVPCR